MDRCPQCRAFHQRCREIGEQLTREAVRTAGVGRVSPALHSRIVPRYRGKTTSAARGGRARANRRRLPALAAAAALALLAILAVSFYFGDRSPATPAVELSDETHPVVWLADPPALAAASASAIEVALEQAVEEQVAALRTEGLAAADVLLAVLPLDPNPQDNADTP